MRRFALTGSAALALALAGCAQQGMPPVEVGYAAPAAADVNASYGLGRLNLAQPRLPTLADMENIRRVHADPQLESKEDRLRAPALRDAALSYGVRGGLAWASQQINTLLEKEAPRLTRIYDFNRFLIREPGGVTLLPPVISETDKTYEQSDAGATLRVADRYYRIDQQARFAPVAPLWHSYLIRTYTPPSRPDEMLLPKNDGERDLWRRYVDAGWEKGEEQAREIFKLDLARLNRDYGGMIRYYELMEKGEVSTPVVADQNLGVTGDGQEMRVNDRAYRLTREPRLNASKPSGWTAPVSGLTPAEAAQPPGGAPPNPGMVR